MTYSKEFRAVDTAGHSLTVFWNKIVFLLKIGVHEGENVDEKSDKEWHKKEGVQPKKWFHSHKFFYVLSFITQSFPHGFSWTSNNITASTKKNISKSLPVYPRWLYISFAKNYYNSSTLSIWVAYTYMCVWKCNCI